MSAPDDMQSLIIDDMSDDTELSIDDIDVQSALDVIELVIELDDDASWAKPGTTAAAKLPATSSAATIETSFFIRTSVWELLAPRP